MKDESLFHKKEVPQLTVFRGRTKRYLSPRDRELIKARVEAEKQREMAEKRLQEKKRAVRTIKKGNI
jgi:hypothetical protein